MVRLRTFRRESSADVLLQDICNGTSSVSSAACMWGLRTQASCPKSSYENPARNIGVNPTEDSTNLHMNSEYKMLTLTDGIVAESDCCAASRTFCDEVTLIGFGFSREFVSHAALKIVFPVLRNTLSPLLTVSEDIQKHKITALLNLIF